MHDAAPDWAASGARHQLQCGLAALGLSTEERLVEALLAYLALLLKWNRAYNLTAVREPLAMVQRHLLDSLSIAPWVHGAYVLDVGTGAGLPGIPLALCQPQRHFVLLDSNSKKTRFLFQARTALALHNVDIVQQRVETYAPTRLYDCILSRAFAPLAQIHAVCAPLLAPAGQLLAMKGVLSEDELAAVAATGARLEVHPLHVPGLDEQRALVTLQTGAAASASCGA